MMMSAKLKNVFEIVSNLIDIPDCFYSTVSLRDCGSIKTSLFLATALILFFTGLVQFWRGHFFVSRGSRLNSFSILLGTDAHW